MDDSWNRCFDYIVHLTPLVPNFFKPSLAASATTDAFSSTVAPSTLIYSSQLTKKADA